MVVLALGLVLAVAVVAAGVLAWPHARLGSTDAALAVVSLPGYAGRVEAVDVHAANGATVPVQLQGDQVWPVRRLAVGQPLTVEVTVRRPSWAGWLVGRTERRTFTIETPQRASARPLAAGEGGRAGDGCVRRSREARLARRLGARGRSLRPRSVPVGVVARGSDSAGAIEVSAAARSWERMPAPVRVSWFPERAYTQLLAEPRPGSALAPDRALVLTFSGAVADVLGARRPVLSPATPGRWKLLDAHTIAFQPTGPLGFGLGSERARRAAARRAPRRAAGHDADAHAHVAGSARLDAAAAAAPRPARLPAAGLAADRRTRRRSSLLGPSSPTPSRRRPDSSSGASGRRRRSCRRCGWRDGRTRSRAAR